jgi:hypothetical protein
MAAAGGTPLGVNRQPLSDVMLQRVLAEKGVAMKLLKEVNSDVAIDKVRKTAQRRQNDVSICAILHG